VDTDRIYQRITHERERQSRLVESGSIPWDCADQFVGHDQKLAVLVEEVGKVARVLIEKPNWNLGDNRGSFLAKLREELNQVAAVSVAWLEAIDAELEEFER